MTPNATVSYMTAQLEHQLLEAKAARDRTPGSGPIRLPLRLLAILAGRFDGHHGTVTTAQSRSHAALGVVDPAR